MRRYPVEVYPYTPGTNVRLDNLLKHFDDEVVYIVNGSEGGRRVITVPKGIDDPEQEAERRYRDREESEEAA